MPAFCRRSGLSAQGRKQAGSGAYFRPGSGCLTALALGSAKAVGPMLVLTGRSSGPALEHVDLRAPQDSACRIRADGQKQGLSTWRGHCNAVPICAPPIWTIWRRFAERSTWRCSPRAFAKRGFLNDGRVYGPGGRAKARPLSSCAAGLLPVAMVQFVRLDAQ